MLLLGYNAILISTIVDVDTKGFRYYVGYNAILISTIVDERTVQQSRPVAIMLF